MDVTPDRLIALATAKPTTPPPMTTQGTFSIVRNTEQIKPLQIDEMNWELMGD